jgi:hypothetical protein
LAKPIFSASFGASLRKRLFCPERAQNGVDTAEKIPAYGCPISRRATLKKTLSAVKTRRFTPDFPRRAVSSRRLVSGSE